MGELAKKKFLDRAGTGYLWQKIQTELDRKGKINSVTATNASLSIAGTASAPSITVNISAVGGNSLELKNDGLYIAVPVAAEYTITKLDTPSEGASASYQLKKDGSNIGTVIDVPNDMVVESGAVVEKDSEGSWGVAGTYIELTLANATNDKIYINVNDLIEYVTSGSQVGDMIFLTVDNQHRISATITDYSITKVKFVNEVQTSLNLADEALQKSDATTGTTNGTINIDGDDIEIKNLDSAAFVDTIHFDTSGAADDTYVNIQSFTNNEIDNIIAEAIAAMNVQGVTADNGEPVTTDNGEQIIPD